MVPLKFDQNNLKWNWTEILSANIKFYDILKYQVQLVFVTT